MAKKGIKNRTHYLTLICLIYPVCCLYSSVYRDSDWSSILFSEDKKLVYIDWIANKPISPYEIAKSGFSESEFLITNYPKSGLYVLKGRRFLWQSPNGPIEPFNDGHYGVVIYGLVSNYDETGVVIVKDGKAFKKYKAGTFCREDYNLSYDNRHIWLQDSAIDSNKKELNLKACNQYFTLDVTTGEISRESAIYHNLKKAWWIFIIFLLVRPINLIGRTRSLIKRFYPESRL